MDELFISYGNAIKTLEKKGDLVTLGAHGILWGDTQHRDLVGDFFVPETNLGATKGIGVNTMLHHGIPLSPQLTEYSSLLLPPTIKAEPDKTGLLVATVYDMRNRYQRKMAELCEEGVFSWSSGANPRGVLREGGARAGKIIQWPLMEFSMTPTPCEPRMSSILPLKSLPEIILEAPQSVKAVRVLADLESDEQARDGVKEQAMREIEENKAAMSTQNGIAPYPDFSGDVVAMPRRETSVADIVNNTAKECSVCGKEAPAGAVVCPHCGAAIEAKYSPDQPRDEEGRWSIVRGQSHRITGQKVDASHIHKIAKDLELSGHARNALLKAHKEGKIKNDGHLLRTIAAADDAMNVTQANRHHGIIAAAVELHGAGGTHENKPWRGGGDKKVKKSEKKSVAGEWVEDEVHIGIKSEFFPNIGTQITGAAIRQLVDELMYRIFDALDQTSELQRIGLSTLIPMPLNDRLDYVRQVFAEFNSIALSLVETLLQNKGDETAQEAAKSLNPDIAESLSHLEAGLRDGLRFGDHSEKVLAANSEFHNRVDDLLEDRARSRKAGRVLSKDNHERLCSHLDALRELSVGLQELLAMHAPEDVADTPKDVAKDSVPQSMKSESELDAEMLEAEIRFMAMTAELQGVSVS